MSGEAGALSGQQFEALHSQLLDQGGYSVDPKTGKQPSSGWMVSRAGSEGKFELPGSANDIREHYVEHRPAIERAGFMGGWSHEGHGYADASKRFPDTAKGMQRATRSMRRQKQTAIYEPSSDTTYYNNPRPGSPEHEANLQATSRFLDKALKGFGHG